MQQNNLGWECLVCHVCYAPWQDKCECKNKKEAVKHQTGMSTKCLTCNGHYIVGTLHTCHVTPCLSYSLEELKCK